LKLFKQHAARIRFKIDDKYGQMHTYSLRTRLADVKLRAYGADGRNAIRCQAGGDVAVADEGLAEPRPAGRGGRGPPTPTGPNERHAPQIAMARYQRRWNRGNPPDGDFPLVVLDEDEYELIQGQDRK
jgi:hypothetical protein